MTDPSVMNYKAIDAVAEIIVESIERGGTVWACGNGGSAEQANHLAAELVGRFKRAGRAPLPAVSLAANTATITAIANDFGFEQVFSRQVGALAVAGDVLVAISTSGTSRNVIDAVHLANELHVNTIGMCAYDADVGDHSLYAVADRTLFATKCGAAGAQEDHLHYIHRMCDLIDAAFAPEQTSDGETNGSEEEASDKEGRAA